MYGVYSKDSGELHVAIGSLESAGQGESGTWGLVKKEKISDDTQIGAFSYDSEAHDHRQIT